MYAIEWGGAAEDVTIRMSGPWAWDEVVGAFAKLRMSPEYRLDLRILLDQRDVDWSTVTGSEIRRHVENLGFAAAPDDRRRIAVVVDRQLAFGFQRMLSAYVLGESTALRSNVFYDLDAAREWLQAPDANTDQ